MIKVGFSVTGDIVDLKAYRSTEPFDVNNLPAVFKQLDVTDREFVDDTALKDTPYFYLVIGTDNTGSFVLSDVKAICIIDYTNKGPGPETPVFGDWWIGYFGTCPIEDVFEVADFKTNLALPSNFTNTVDQPTEAWKIQFKGVTYYIPNRVPYSGMSFMDVYRTGVLLDTVEDGVGTLPSSLTNPAVMQGKIYSRNGNSFAVGCIPHGDKVVYTNATDAMVSLHVMNDLALDTFERLFNTAVNPTGQLYSGYQRSRYGNQLPSSIAPGNGLNIFYKAVTEDNRCIQRGFSTSIAHQLDNAFTAYGSSRGFNPALRLIR